MHKPGVVRDAIIGHLKGAAGGASIKQIHTAVEKQIGEVAASSVRSYLRLNTPLTFEKLDRGQYRLKAKG